MYPSDNTFIGDFTLGVPQLDVQAIVVATDHHRAAIQYLTLRRLMSYIYIYGAPILDVSRSHTTMQHSR